MKIGNLEVYGIIYKITNVINDKSYIGQTVNGFNKRYPSKGIGIKRYYNFNKKMQNIGRYYNCHLQCSIEKYGFDAFKVDEIIDFAFSKEELNIKEKMYIQIYDTINNGYNETSGGSDYTASEELRSKLKEIQKECHVKGETHPKTKNTNEEIILLKKDLCEGKDIEYVMNKYKISRKNVLRIMRLERWIDIGSEYNEYLNSNISRKDHSHDIPIIAFDKHMNVIKRYDSQVEACKDLKIAPSKVSACCLFNIKFTGNYVFLKDDEHLEENIKIKKEQLKLVNFKIAKLDSNNNIIEIYNNMEDAMLKLGLPKTTIMNALYGRNKIKLKKIYNY